MSRIFKGLCLLLCVCFFFSITPMPASAESVDCADTITTGVSPLECEALVAIYNNTNGQGWTKSYEWLTPSAVETWYGVGVTDGHVSGMLNLYDNNLTGRLPQEIGDLEWVTYFYLAQNHLTGTIPPEIADVTGLEYLYLQSNELTGEIPAELFSLPGIKDIVLSGNHLSGQIPTELGNATTLERFIVNDNDLTGELPVGLGDLTGLSYFSVAGNDFYGQLPPGMAGWSTPMSVFNIRYNGFWTTDPELAIYLDSVQPGWDIDLGTQALEPSHRDFVGWGKLAESEEFSPKLVFSKFFYRSGSAAQKYLVLIYKSDNTKIMEVELTDVQVCPPGGGEITAVCTFVPEWSDFIEPPSTDSYYWLVFSSDGSGWTWNDKKHDFTIVSPPNVFYPINTTTRVNPTFKWQPVIHANAYNLVVIDSASGMVMDEVVPSSSCTISECMYTPSTSILSLENGDFTWKVRADMGVESFTDWGEASFTKVAGPAPRFPAVSSTMSSPKFTWTPSEGQTRYQVQLYTLAGVKMMDKTFDTTVCTSTLCTYNPSPALTLANGAYKWKVRAGEAVEWGTYSGFKPFNKVTPPVPVSPTGTITAGNPTFKWKKIAGATRYYLELRKLSGTLVKAVTISSPTCMTYTCTYSFNPVLNLVNGDYKWHLKAYNGYYGPYGVDMKFKKQ